MNYARGVSGSVEDGIRNERDSLSNQVDAYDADLRRALDLLQRWKANQLQRNANGESCPQGVFEETGALLAEFDMDIRLQRKKVVPSQGDAE